MLRLVERAGESGSPQSAAQEVASPLPAQLRRIALDLIEQGRSSRSAEAEQVGRTFLATGQLAVRALRAGIMAKPQFLGRRVAMLRRGQKVTVLDRVGAWYRVRTDSGAGGWMHGNRLIPRIVRLRPGDTGTGNTRGEWETSARG
ncbi:MAG: SH3 domain-containing protein [Anaerolineae bacterium]